MFHFSQKTRVIFHLDKQMSHCVISTVVHQLWCESFIYDTLSSSHKVTLWITMLLSFILCSPKELLNRAVMILGLGSAPESDFGSFFTSDYDDSGSGSFSLESAPFARIGSRTGIGSTVGKVHC